MSVAYFRSAVGLRADQSATRDAMPRLHSTMSASLIKDLAEAGQFPPLSLQCFRGQKQKPHMKEFKE